MKQNYLLVYKESLYTSVSPGYYEMLKGLVVLTLYKVVHDSLKELHVKRREN